jgi:hypothetical protein
MRYRIPCGPGETGEKALRWRGGGINTGYSDINLGRIKSLIANSHPQCADVDPGR